MHTPVLLQQAIEKLNIKPHGLYIDATYGEGGYSEQILMNKGKVLAIDLDFDQIKKSKLKENENIKLVEGNFSNIESIAKENSFYPVDGIVFDLGLSMAQLGESGRGFSYKNLEEPLDMRISVKNEMTVKELINKSTVDKLYEIFAKNSEELKSKEIASEIKSRKKMSQVKDLINVIDSAIGYSSSSTKARIFQAFRIAINNEFENLKNGLNGAVKILKPEGRIVIVSFHSLEDRIIKNFVRENNLKFLEKKPILGVRKFERSAKLRVITV